MIDYEFKVNIDGLYILFFVILWIMYSLIFLGVINAIQILLTLINTVSIFFGLWIFWLWCIMKAFEKNFDLSDELWELRKSEKKKSR